ncbi:hypothetical protein NLJ89_g7197 [Agrocybe chaxingu]|uniref:Uncharacterized protein n=1 Tax=Agrocybe chaxingu TaxID=84603 RepID=A0A9W8MRZ8_9AGAR|nr:hypothetical protein NLJ89_g7197 [Agrocybe chaxingu]
MLLPTLFVACLFRIVRPRPISPWKETPFDPLNFGGQHRVTSNPSATATFNFTGVAIYFYSPLWPFQVNTAISIDGQSPIFVDLTDYTQTPFVVDGPETVASDVVWDATGLDNKEHTLVVSVALGQQHAVVDGLVP